MTERAFLFPGQGAQKVGMGKDLYDSSPAAKSIFDQADDALGRSLSREIFDGPDDVLKDTATQQPAIVTVSIAALEAFRERFPDFPAPVAAAGLSLGEYAALYCAGAFDFSTCITLVALRGKLMKQASEQNAGAMSVVLQLDPDIIRGVCADIANETGMVLSPANFNCEGQVVIAGAVDAVTKAEPILKDKGARRVMRLPVSGAFHTALMQPAADGLKEALENAAIRSAAIPVYSNVNAHPITEPDAIRNNLYDQLTGSVLWMASMRAIIQAGCSHFLEFAPGTTLAGMMKRIDSSANVVSLPSFDAIRAFTPGE